MTSRVIFNGAVLIRPGAATKIDVSKFNVATLSGVGVVALIGNADGGKPRTLVSFRSPKAVKDYFRSGDLVDAASILASPANDPRLGGQASTIYCYKVNGSVQSSLTVQSTAAASNAKTQLTQSGPYTILDNDTLNYASDLSGGPATIVFSGTSALKMATAPMVFPADTPVALTTLVVSANGGGLQTFTFTGAETSITLVEALINATATGFVAADNGAGTLKLVSTQFGTGSTITVDASSTALATTHLTAGAGTAGTGDAVDLAAMTEAELKVVIDATGDMVLDITTSPPTLYSPTLGVTSSLTISASTPVTVNTNLGLTVGVYAGSAAGAPTDTVKFVSKDYGSHTNTINTTLTDPSPTSLTRVLTITQTLDGVTNREVSPTLGGSAKWQIRYVGAGTAAVMTITTTSLTTAVTGGPGGENLSFTLSDFPHLEALIEAVNATGGSGVYTASSLITNASDFAPSDLDWVTGVDIRTATYGVYSRVFDLVDWVNSNSNICDAERLPTGSLMPDAYSTAKYLTGGIKGTSTNTHWTDALSALAMVRVNQVVPLCDSDPSAAIGTYTFAAVAAATSTHAQVMSSTAGRSERQAWIGYAATKANLITMAQTLNSEHTCLSAEGLKLPSGRLGNLTDLPKWSSAVALAGMRAIAPIAEPLTKKYVRAFGLNRTWDDTEDGAIEDLLLAGVTLILQNPDNGAYQVEKGITTYTKSENNAYTEESIVSAWKIVSYDLRTQLENTFTGTKATLPRINDMKNMADTILNHYGPVEDGGLDVLVKGVDENGVETRPYRDLSIQIGANGNPSDVAELSVICQFVSGINFQLHTIFAVPASLSVRA